jgi:peptidoglycan/LPS O-acetylase OafA/YrhL
MVAFPIAMIVITSSYTKGALLRLSGLIAGADNILTALLGYSGIPFSAQLWTLSFEFQIYAIIPFFFLAYWRFGLNRFVYLVAAIWLSGTILRLAVLPFISNHLVHWVIPVLRPDSILVGLLLSVVQSKFYLPHAVVVGSVSSVAFFALPSIEEWRVSAALDYPIAALMCGSLVILGLRWSRLNNLLSLPFMRFAGSISFGLYVFHFIGIYMATKILSPIGHFEPQTDAADYALLALSAFAFTFCISVVSYFLFERQFLRMKDKFTIVQGRKPVN